MADQQITDLPVATALDDADLLLTRQGSTDKQVTKAIAFAQHLKSSNNLSDIPNAGTARTNLDVPQIGATVLRANNLSDLASASTSRTNLGVAIGSNVQAWSAQLDAVAAFSASTGLFAQTAANTVVARTLTAPAAGFTITNPAGTAGNPTFVLANDLGALEGLSSTGIAVRSASDTWVQRTITGTANQIAVADGNGVSGNPTLTLPAQIILPSHATAGSITMLEGSANGTNTFKLEAPSIITNNYSWKNTATDVPTVKSLLKIDTSGNINYAKPTEAYLSSLVTGNSWSSTSIFDSSYDYYRIKIKITELVCSTNNKKLLLQLYADGAWRTASYLCSGTGLDANGATYSVNTTSGAGFIICNNNASNPSRIEMMDLMLTKDGSIFGDILSNNTGYYAPVKFGGFSGGGSITTLQGARILLDDGTTTNLSGEVLVFGCNDVSY